MTDLHAAIWADDDDFVSRQNTRYSWNEAAMMTMERPGKWLLVSEDAPPSTVSNVNSGIIKAFAPYILDGWSFVARSSDVYTPDEEHPYRRRGKVWLKAERTEETE